MTDSDSAYQVLARKYRPATFADLRGQDAMVRTLKNAFESDRIAQAFMMTGIRGTGKTSTARLIAKGMNCTGPDGTGGPTTEPCNTCDNCNAISEGRHVDVMEIDAASHTGVQNVRDVIIDTVAYAPSQARYKVFIIDEVHMLSSSAFNALLKTLEEPPAHVKFIFATTEIRKVPVTVLSRCQRFDLRRFEPEVMIDFLKDIAGKEGATVAGDAHALITRAAEGSARDALSLLDQAISQSISEVSAEDVRAMLGLADRGRVLDLFELILQGKAPEALTELSRQYADGADPLAILRDLTEITHWVSVVKITPEAAEDPTVSPDERDRGQALAQDIPMRVLTRMWQMLLKALEEVGHAPNAMMAAEMIVIRLTHVADLPSPEELIRKLQDTPPPAPAGPGGNGGGVSQSGSPAGSTASAPRSTQGTGGGNVLAIAPAEANPLARYATFQNVIALIRSHRDAKLLVDVETGVRLVSYAPGRIEFSPAPSAPNDLAQVLGQRLQNWTGARWAISVVAEGGAPTIDEERNADQIALMEKAQEHPLVQSVFDAFPEAKITEIRTPEEIEAVAAQDALPEVEDEWDPFEED